MVITSKDNKLIKNIKRLFVDNKYRKSTNTFACETMKIVDHCLANNLKNKYIITSENCKLADKYENVILVSEKIFSYLSNVANYDGIIGVFEIKKNVFEIKENNNYVILDKIQNPTNLALIVRTCLAFNISGIIISNDSVDIYNSETIRKSMGACLTIPFLYSTDISINITNFKNKNFKIFATALEKDSKKLKDVNFSNQNVIIFGNEGNGISKKIINLCDEKIIIEQDEKINSLNVGTSVGIILYKLYTNI